MDIREGDYLVKIKTSDNQNAGLYCVPAIKQDDFAVVVLCASGERALVETSPASGINEIGFSSITSDNLYALRKTYTYGTKNVVMGGGESSSGYQTDITIDKCPYKWINFESISVDDIVVCSSKPIDVLIDGDTLPGEYRVLAEDGFILADVGGYIDAKPLYNLHVAVSGNSFIEPMTSNILPDEFNALASGAGIPLVYQGDYLSLDQFNSYGNFNATYGEPITIYFVLLVVGTGYLNCALKYRIFK